jgi:hypothetical protein
MEFFLYKVTLTSVHLESCDYLWDISVDGKKNGETFLKLRKVRV